MGNKTIYAIEDYRGYFESKIDAVPFNAGMDKNLLKKNFAGFGFELIFIEFAEVMNYPATFWENKFVIYISAEDKCYHYKTFIEDIIYYLELSKAIVMPSFKYLRANNNKVFMELLRHQYNVETSNIQSKVFGCYEEFKKVSDTLEYPLVYKQAAGAMSAGVGLIKSPKDLGKLKKIARTRYIFSEIWEYWRSVKFKVYTRESKYRNKFIVQKFVEGLDGDYKILIYKDKLYVLKRGVKEGDFKASGSGIKYFVKDLPEGMLDFAYNFYKNLNVPNVSIDVAYNGTSFFIVEFQCLYFGSFTISCSDYYWLKKENGYEFIESKSELEYEYANSICQYIQSL